MAAPGVVLVEGTYYVPSVNLGGQASGGDVIAFVDVEDIP